MPKESHSNAHTPTRPLIGASSSLEQLHFYARYHTAPLLSPVSLLSAGLTSAMVEINTNHSFAFDTCGVIKVVVSMTICVAGLTWFILVLLQEKEG